ncbi:hypothetical protein, partial [Hallella absiana]|uniref:hypothetical protein n=1 Tax=Hallella absiana TaxID=2925336 RepID=UPI0021C947D4
IFSCSMTAKVSKKNSFSTLSYQVLWLGSGIRLPRTIPLGPLSPVKSNCRIWPMTTKTMAKPFAMSIYSIRLLIACMIRIQ